MTSPSESPEAKRICVYAGSSPGASDAFARAAHALGSCLAGEGIELVYGGGSVGLMDVLANAALAEGGRVTGVITQALLDREVAHQSLSDLHVVQTMHERKALMADLSDAFIALPGGFGTLDETFEALTWTQLGIHHKPVGLLNVEGYFDPLMQFVEHAVAQRFVSREHADSLLIATAAPELVDRIRSFRPPQSGKWLDRKQAPIRLTDTVPGGA